MVVLVEKWGVLATSRSLIYVAKGGGPFLRGRGWCDVFFFSSRRRHTRFDCDWSSDVCSSDLGGGRDGGRRRGGLARRARADDKGDDGEGLVQRRMDAIHLGPLVPPGVVVRSGGRSEERRGGKEGRSRGVPHT